MRTGNEIQYLVVDIFDDNNNDMLHRKDSASKIRHDDDERHDSDKC